MRAGSDIYCSAKAGPGMRRDCCRPDAGPRGVATCLFPGCVLSCSRCALRMRRQSSVTITSGRLDGCGARDKYSLQRGWARAPADRAPGIGSDVTRPAYVVVVVCGGGRAELGSAVSRRHSLINQSLSSAGGEH